MWTSVPLIAMALALILTVRKKNKQIKEITYNRDFIVAAHKEAITACVLAISKATNRDEIEDFFIQQIRTGNEIKDSYEGFYGTGMTEEEAMTRILVHTEIINIYNVEVLGKKI